MNKYVGINLKKGDEVNSVQNKDLTYERIGDKLYVKTDLFYGPYESLTIACRSIPSCNRYYGLTIFLKDGFKYWWTEDLSDFGIVAKQDAFGPTATNGRKKIIVPEYIDKDPNNLRNYFLQFKECWYSIDCLTNRHYIDGFIKTVPGETTVHNWINGKNFKII